MLFQPRETTGEEESSTEGEGEEWQKGGQETEGEQLLRRESTHTGGGGPDDPEPRARERADRVGVV